jgi:hypothetical protein
MRSTTPPGPDVGADGRAALVGCGADKLDRAAAARKLYTSGYFAAKRDYADERCETWWIISAKHNLLEPSTVIEPYEKQVSKFNDQETKRWGTETGNQLRAIDWDGLGIETVDILLGQQYIEPIEDALAAIPPTCCFLFDQTAWNGEQKGLLYVFTPRCRQPAQREPVR